MTLSSTMKAALATAAAAALNGGSFKIKTAGGSVLETISGVTWSASANVASSSNPAGSAIDASGTAATYEIYDSSNNLMVSGTVGTSGAELIVDSTTFTMGVTYDQGVFTLTF
jgi:hypothetical protein